ncbi:ankyrin repeat domain-containing protein [Estrella lausannensis]|uniref:Uncharacterized protein n=1 Tax=Estrella lausannensis TaxID=483423 RepID=A0A0H5E4M8_9BACT|nr:ankyrin repeat domain-containing protein [Estrella lausannensis]CRX38185.1 hypothetical protein ELAC_0836 [Estrella lausannensis]
MQPIHHTSQINHDQPAPLSNPPSPELNADNRTERVGKRLRDAVAQPEIPTKKRRIQSLEDHNLNEIDERIVETSAPIKKLKKSDAVDSTTKRKRTIWTKKALQFVVEKISLFKVLQKESPDSFDKILQLLTLMLELGRSKGIGASLTEGHYKGANFLWLTTYFSDWKIALNIAELFPELDVNATPEDPLFKGHTCLYNATMKGDWHYAFSLSETRPLIDWSLCPENTQSPLWWAASQGKWEIVRQALTASPSLNINEAPKDGNEEGVTIFLLACAQESWDTVQFMLDLNLPIDFDVEAKPTSLLSSGGTPLYLACSDQKWDIATQILRLDANLDCDAAPRWGPSVGITPFWSALCKKQHDMARLLLERKPTLNLDATPLWAPQLWTTSFRFGTHEPSKFILEHKNAPDLSLSHFGEIMGDITPMNLALMTDRGFAKLLVILGASKYGSKFDSLPDQDGKSYSATEILEAIMNELHSTRVKIFELLYNQWNISEIDAFEEIRRAGSIQGQDSPFNRIRRKLALQILLDDHPDIIPIKGLEDHMDRFADLENARNWQAKAIISSLAYREYRWSNEITKYMAPKAISDIKNMIMYCLDSEQKKRGTEYTQSLRHKIIEQIGKEQEGEPKLTKAFVKKAIRTAVDFHSTVNKS